jgi:3-oxoacyl-ACP reductase-like protein
MGILSNIFGKIFPSSHAQSAPSAPASPEPTSAVAPTAAAPQAAPMQEVDVEAILNGLASKNPEKLNWKTSIVDLMKLLSLDSSLGQRKDLAKELGYSGDTNDSASMNIWLHRQVMNKLAANGGKVPAELKD